MNESELLKFYEDGIEAIEMLTRPGAPREDMVIHSLAETMITSRPLSRQMDSLRKWSEGVQRSTK